MTRQPCVVQLHMITAGVGDDLADSGGRIICVKAREHMCTRVGQYALEWCAVSKLMSRRVWRRGNGGRGCGQST